jgi:hypothetical protein
MHVCFYRIVEREKRRLSFNDGPAGNNTPYSSSRTPTPKPTPGREPIEISRLLPIDEYTGNGHHEGPSSYGSTLRTPGSQNNGDAERGRERDRSQFRHEGLYTDSPTRT